MVEARLCSLLTLVCFPGWSYVCAFNFHLYVHNLKILHQTPPHTQNGSINCPFPISPGICWSDLTLTTSTTELTICPTEPSALYVPFHWKQYHILSSHIGRSLLILSLHPHTQSTIRFSGSYLAYLSQILPALSFSTSTFEAQPAILLHLTVSIKVLTNWFKFRSCFPIANKKSLLQILKLTTSPPLYLKFSNNSPPII